MYSVLTILSRYYNNLSEAHLALFSDAFNFQEKKKIERSGSREHKDPNQGKEQESRQRDKEDHHDHERTERHHRSEKDHQDKSREQERERDKGRVRERDRDRDKEKTRERDSHRDRSQDKRRDKDREREGDRSKDWNEKNRSGERENDKVWQPYLSKFSIEQINSVAHMLRTCVCVFTIRPECQRNLSRKQPKLCQQ